ncbi:MAG TPA: hypothetical protein VIW07_03805 [Candidatus Udaeobacter sp.]|jgi:hypothetical protein
MATTFQPGDLARRFANLFKWPIAERIIIVEGEHDQRYLALADQLYRKETGLHLLGKRLVAFPTGIGDEGGTYGILKHFHPFRTVIDRDVIPTGKKVFHAIALFDDDFEGRRAFNALAGQHLNYIRWRDIFLLRRVMPRTTRANHELIKLIDVQNAAWKDMECVIEDFVSFDVVTAFLQDHPGAMLCDPQRTAGGMHCVFRPQFKSTFVRFVETNALLQDVQNFVELLKSLRYHLGLPPDGEIE